MEDKDVLGSYAFLWSSGGKRAEPAPALSFWIPSPGSGVLFSVSSGALSGNYSPLTVSSLWVVWAIFL